MNKENLKAFYAIADIAATNWYFTKASNWRKLTWSEAKNQCKRVEKRVTFRNPNFAHPTGYFAALKHIAKSENGLTRKELCNVLKIKDVSLTTNTLRYAKMIVLDSHKFTITPFGREYLTSAEIARPEMELLIQARKVFNSIKSFYN